VLDVLPDTLPLAASEGLESASGKTAFGPEKPRRGFGGDPPETAPEKAAQAAGIAPSCRALGYETASGRSLWKVYGPDLNGRFGGLQGTGGLEAVILDADGTTTGVINDQFGNGVATVTGTGSGASVTWNTTRVGAYGPLPGIQAQTLSDVTQLAAATAWRSHRIDPTGFYWLGARYYEPTSGRFLSADPAGHAASPSLYDYAGGDPVNFFDPTGRCKNGGKDTFDLNGNKIPYNQGDGIWTTPDDIYRAVAAVNAFNAQNSQTGSSGLTFGETLKAIGQGVAGTLDFWQQAIVDPNAPGSTIIAGIEGAGEGIRNTVSLTAEGALNVLPLVGGKVVGPGPVGGGLGGSADLSFNDGLKLNPAVTGGKFGLSGDAGITFKVPGLSGPQTYNLSVAGGSGPGGAINISFGPNFVPTHISITIGVGFGWEVSGNLPIPVNGGGH
jgi:RHS repeat-associated protein